MSLPQSTIRLVRESGGMLPVGAPGPVQAFYERLFELAPEVQPLFTGDPAVQARKLADMLAWVLVHLDAPEVLVPALRDLGARHAGYGVEIDDYAPVGSALIGMFQRTLGERFTDAMEDAWLELYAYISAEMERGARLRA